MPGNRWVRTLQSIPYADRRDVAAGYAMGGVGAVTAVLWYGLVGLLRVVGPVGPIEDGLLDLALGGSVFVAPLAVAVSFVVGTLLWRRFAPSTPAPRRGAVLGAATAVGSLAVGALGFGMLGLALALRGDTLGSVLDALVAAAGFAALALAFGLVFAGWLVLPVGALAGWYHERALRQSPSRAATERAVE